MKNENFPILKSNSSVNYTSILSIIGVALLWGATNPFIRKGSAGFNEVDREKIPKHFGHKIWSEVKFLVSRWQYVLPLILNQCGSVLFVYTLQSTELSLTVPIANSLSFVFTAITANLLGEQKPNLKVYLGMLLVICGTALCSYDKFS